MTYMAQETREAPDAAERFLKSNGEALAALGVSLRRMRPPVILTSARGSSDNAAGYLKYLAEILLGVPCASVGASVASLYGARLKAKDALAVTISQSGKSPDIVALQNEMKRAGALTVAAVNDAESPAARDAALCLPLHAGPERSVAATKSCIVSLVAAAAIVASWLDDAEFRGALSALPEQLRAAARSEWPEFAGQLAKVESLYVLGRGPSLPIAAETALKLKETCAIHAEAYSAAEVMHGPLELVGEGFHVLAYAQRDASLRSTTDAIVKLRAAGARVLVVGQGGLPVTAPAHPLLEPILMLQSAYLAIEELARLRGRNPDAPRMLRKVTETV